MTFDFARALEHVHGHVGWLAVATLVHPAVVLRGTGMRRATWAVGLATAFVTATAAMGVGLYPMYRQRVKRAIFETEPDLGWLFERKEHLAFGALLLAWAGALAYIGSVRASKGASTELAKVTALLRTASQRAFVCASALAFLSALFGTIVASYKSF